MDPTERQRTPLTERGRQVRRDTLRFSLDNGGYHFGGSLSVVEILIALYDRMLEDDDVAIMSKGHAWWPQQVLLRERGLDPEICGHPQFEPGKGIQASTGSLGHGIPLGVGRALGKKLQGQPGHVYVVAGDGELQEGTLWESLLLGRRFVLSNLTVIVDNNGIQGSGRTDDILSVERVPGVAHMMGWNSGYVNGHEIDRICNSLVLCKEKTGPSLIFANTIKGRGVSYMEDRPEWHAAWPSDEQQQQAFEELA